jgi:molybdopterin molybdotransferase
VTAPLAAGEAARRILDDVRRQPPLRMPLDDALDAVLAEAVVSPLDIPAWTNSAMDGYAAQGADVRGATAERPVRLRVVEHIPAGSFPSRAVGPGECARIFTGAPLPEGADTVIRQEDTDCGAETVTIVRDRDVGVNFRRAGEDIRRGATVLSAGSELGPAQLGVLASLAVAHPLVYRQPRIGILGSGDEIVDVDQPEEILSGRKTASSNTHTLMALVRRAGAEPVNLGIARDTPDSLRERLRRGLDTDLLVTTAGISVGEHDYLRGVLEELGVEERFWKLRMRPGAPVGFGLLDGVPWIGLPGNPVSTMVTFELFVRPAIRRMSGHLLPFRRAVPVRAAEPITVRPRLQHFLRAVVSDGPGGAGSPAHRTAGLGHSHVHGPGQRPAGDPGRPVRDPARRDGTGDPAGRPAPSGRPPVLARPTRPWRRLRSPGRPLRFVP